MGLFRRITSIFRPVAQLAKAAAPLLLATPLAPLAAPIIAAQALGAVLKPQVKAITAPFREVQAAVAAPAREFQAAVRALRPAPIGAGVINQMGVRTMGLPSIITTAGRLLGVGTGVGAARVAGRAVGAATSAANRFCSRNPALCASLGGLPAVAGLFSSGQLKIPRRTRRGISWADIRRTRRVIRVLRKMEADLGAPLHRRARPAARSTGSNIVAIK